MQSSPLISIIIPCYNGALYIENTLDHVLQQTYNNWECIIVDDGSLDNSKQIIEAFTTKDNRFIYYYQDNQGLSGSRNSGTKISKGSYIYYLDTDDLIADSTLETLISLANTGADIVFGKTAITDGHNKNIIGYLEHFLPKNQLLKNDNHQLIPLVLKHKLSCVAHNRLYKKEFIVNNNLQFKDRLLHEDELWFFETLINCKSITLSDAVTYFYNTGNQNSITNNFGIKNTKAYLNILNTIHEKYYINGTNNEKKEIALLYLNHLKMIVITHCYYNTSKNQKEEVEKLIINTFNRLETPISNYKNLDKDIKKLHLRFNKVLKLGIEKTLNYLRWYKSKSIKKIIKRNLLLLSTKFI